MSNEKDCCNCLYTNRDLRVTPCRDCENYDKWKTLPERPTPRECDNCLYSKRQLSEVPCDDCRGTLKHWQPNCQEEAPTPNMQEPKVEPELRNAHYQTDIQPIEFMQANMSPEAFKGGLLFNIFKYSSRFGKKDDELKEAIKIADYSRWLVLAVQGKKIDPRKD